MDRDYNLISELNDTKTNWIVKLKIDRLHFATRPNIPRDEANLSLIANDEMGDQIHLEIDRDQVSTYEKVLKEGNDVYMISHFHVVPTTSFELIKKDIKIEFMIGTTVAECTSEVTDIPNHIFQFCAFPTILERDGQEDHTIDLIGLLDIIRDTESVPTRYGIIDRTNIVLHDEMENAANVTLWGAASNAFNELNLRGRPDTIILIVTSLMVRQIGGVYRASSTAGTKFYANLDHHDVDAQMERFSGVDRPAKLLPPETFWRSTSGPNIESQELTLSQDRKFTAKVIISGFDMKNYWYYYGCKFCAKTLSTRGTTTNCSGCGARDTNAIPCYKLEAMVRDETGAALFIFFPTAAEQLVGFPLASLLLREPSTRRQLPPRIKSLIETMWELQVTVNFKSYTAAKLVFNVSRVIKQLPRGTLALPAPPPPPPAQEPPRSSVIDRKGKRVMTAAELEAEKKLKKHGTPNPRPRTSICIQEIQEHPPSSLPDQKAKRALTTAEGEAERKRAKQAATNQTQQPLAPPTQREKIAIRLQELQAAVKTMEQCKKLLTEEFAREGDEQGDQLQDMIESESKAIEEKRLEDIQFWQDLAAAGYTMEELDDIKPLAIQYATQDEDPFEDAKIETETRNLEIPILEAVKPEDPALNTTPLATQAKAEAVEDPHSQSLKLKTPEKEAESDGTKLNNKPGPLCYKRTRKQSGTKK